MGQRSMTTWVRSFWITRPCQQPPFRTKLRWKASGLEWQHGNIRYIYFFVFLFGRCGLATSVAFIDACIYCVIHDVNYACCIWTLLQYTNSINQNKIWYVFPLCSWFIFHRWQEPKNLRGLLPSPSWSWCCPIQMQMLRGCFQLWDWIKLRPEIAWHWMAPCPQ